MRFLTAVCFHIFIFSTSGWAATVSFQDISDADQAHLKKAIPALNTNVDLSTLDDAVRVLMNTGTYENVVVDRNTHGDYTLIGRPLRLVEEIRIDGSRDVAKSVLQALLDFKAGDRFDRKRSVNGGEKIKNYYGEHGYFNAVVEIGFEKAGNKNVNVIYTITEHTPCLIKSLTFTTANTDLTKRLNSDYRHFVNELLTTERMHQLGLDLNLHLIELRYLNGEVVGPEVEYNTDKTQAQVHFEVREPYRWEFYFTGNQFFTNGDVYRALDLHNHERRNVDPGAEGSERLRRAYLTEGFTNVQIETQIKSPKEAPFLKRVRYTIKEGVRVKIHAIKVEGRISRPAQYYEEFILNNSSDLVSSGYYNRVDIENGLKNLATELRNQGYLRARVQSSRTEMNDKKDQITVYVLFDEGAQTQIRALEFAGNKFFSSFELAGVTGLETNSALQLTQFEDSLTRLKDFYHRQGFLEMRLLNESQDLIHYNETGTQARIGFQIFEGPRIRVNSIVVEGNTITHTDVILREADFQLGEVLTPQKLDDAANRLNRMGLFSRAEIHTLEEGTNIGERTLVISVHDRDPGTARVGGGVTSERNFTVRGFTGANYNNIMGTARSVSARAEIRENVAVVRYPESEFTVSYMEPFLLGTRTRGRVNFTRSDYVYDYEASLSNFTEITIKNRVDFLLERDLNRHVRGTWKFWSLESRTDFERYGRCLPDPNNPTAVFNPAATGCSPNVMQVATIGPTVDVDYTDNRFLPTRGSFTRLTVDYSNPKMGSSQGVEFIKTDASFSFYKSLGSPRWVWANSLRSGYLSNLSRESGSGVPSDYAFVLGGIYSLRGFDIATPNERVPKDGDAGFHLGETNAKLIHFDSYYYLAKTELRFPLYKDFGGVLFYDGGAVYISGYDFARPYRDSVGFGFRYNTPVGPLALDFAFKIRPDGPEYGEDAEAKMRIQFSIGTF